MLNEPQCANRRNSENLQQLHRLSLVFKIRLDVVWAMITLRVPSIDWIGCTAERGIIFSLMPYGITRRIRWWHGHLDGPLCARCGRPFFITEEDGYGESPKSLMTSISSLNPGRSTRVVSPGCAHFRDRMEHDW